ncbi:MAG TPA: hypothetical protein VHO46_14310 [Bacteroidales bacterium]|nr:hypothetical protein [Bacteroidales bacterium]
MRNLIVISSILISLLLFSSCKRNHYKVNTSSTHVSINIKRLEKDLFSIDPEKIMDSVPVLKDRYDDFLQLFSYVIRTGSINDSSFSDMLVRFCTDKLNNEVYAYTMKIFPGLDQIEKDLEGAFSHYKHYFPDRNIPSVYSCITGFNYSIIAGDSVLGISLDRYLGADCEYYPELGIYSYISARMTPENVVPDCMYGWADSEWEYDSTGYASDNVLAHLIHQGKLKYFEKCMLPDITDEILFGFTQEQMNFCRNNELQMWQYLIEHDLIFSTDQFEIRKLTGEAPFTAYFTKESPGRAAMWLGFRIVENYMMKTSGITLEDLMNEKNLQEILENARYNPK